MVSLPLNDVSTDIIIPTRWSLLPNKADMGRYAFTELRYDAGGGERSTFPFHRPGYRGAPILLAGENFACGSSREPAVWAMQAMGIQAVIAPSFGDIFFQNSFKNGLVAITLDQSSVAALHQAAEQGPHAFCVNLATSEITGPNVAMTFDINPRRRETLMRGLDEIEATLLLVDAIAAFQDRDRESRPWVYNAAVLSRALDAAVLASPFGPGSDRDRTSPKGTSLLGEGS
jgi:3-isopropylmalate/(R)-2-methylmalate dehydratase small subunit